jgi:hypothetical protein
MTKSDTASDGEGYPPLAALKATRPWGAGALSPEGALDEICRRQISFHDLVKGEHDLLCLVIGKQKRGIILG